MFDKNFELFQEYRKGKKTFNVFCNIIKSVNDSEYKSICVDIADYKYMHPCFAVLLASIPYIAEKNNKTAAIHIDPDNSKCIEFLNKTGVLKHFNSSFARKKDYKRAVEFNVLKNREDSYERIEDLIDKFPVKISEDLKNALHSKLYEVFDNAFTHGGQNNTVFCGGTEDSQKNFVFSIYDIGIGIPNNVNNYRREHLKQQEVSAVEALDWALGIGNSTLNDTIDYVRGAGFDTLERFVKVNKGEIIIVSGEAYCKITQVGRSYDTLDVPLLGTFFCMSITKDVLHKYVLRKEL